MRTINLSVSDSTQWLTTSNLKLILDDTAKMDNDKLNEDISWDTLNLNDFILLIVSIKRMNEVKNSESNNKEKHILWRFCNQILDLF